MQNNAETRFYVGKLDVYDYILTKEFEARDIKSHFVRK
jgi:hypothetical protein